MPNLFFPLHFWLRRVTGKVWLCSNMKVVCSMHTAQGPKTPKNIGMRLEHDMRGFALADQSEGFWSLRAMLDLRENGRS